MSGYVEAQLVILCLSTIYAYGIFLPATSGQLNLGAAGFIEAWLVILVVFRDGLIVAGALVYQAVFNNLFMHPLVSSKVNTTLQFLLATMIMGASGFGISL